MSHSTGNASRKYTDLIFSASSKWANWDPPKKIMVGDYGTVDRKTGQFEKEGNIYEGEATAQLAAKYPPETAAKESFFEISSDTVTRCDLTVAPNVSVPGLAEASIRGQWAFNRKRGALLIMDQPQSSYVPPNVFLKQLVNIPALKDKFLVTEVFSCPAYCLYLSSQKTDNIALALLGTSAALPPMAAGGETKFGWWSQNTTGLLRSACDKEYSYTPLYVLKQIRKKGILRRDRQVPDPEDDDLWVDAGKPWDPLDEDGEEELFEDTVY